MNNDGFIDDMIETLKKLDIHDSVGQGLEVKEVMEILLVSIVIQIMQEENIICLVL